MKSEISNSNSPTYNLPTPAPHLLAHYMLWYATAPTWTHWKSNDPHATHDPEKILPPTQSSALSPQHSAATTPTFPKPFPHRDLASVLYPLIGPYDSADPNVLHYHLATMKAAGIEGVIVDWYAHSQTDRLILALLDEAQKLDMRVALMWEEKLPFPNYRHPKNREDVLDAATEDLTLILTQYAKHPAYLRRNNQPVIAQFNAYGPPDPNAGPKKLSPEEFAQIFKRLPETPAYIRQNLDPAYHPLLEGAYTWESRKGYPTQFITQAETLRAAGKLGFYMTMLNPGFNDTGVWGWGQGPRLSPLYGLDKLNETTTHALDGHPELIQLITWNDFNEGTCFEPTTDYGFQFLDAVETWWSAHSTHQLDLQDNRTPYEEYKRTCTPEQCALLPALRR